MPFFDTDRTKKRNGESGHNSWQKTPYANLVRNDSSGTYFARFQLDGKLFWRSLETFHDAKDGHVKLDGENVIAFPKFPEFQQVTLKVLRWEERDNRLVIKEAEMVP
jgi:hypothetical protein